MVKNDYNFYSQTAESYDSLYSEEQNKKLALIMSTLSSMKGGVPKSEDALLDVGCGTGISTAVWCCNTTGIDPCKELIALAKKKYLATPVCKTKSHTKTFLVGCAEALPFKDCSFDYVTALTSIHNFDDYKKGLDEIERVGKKYFILTVLRKSGKADVLVKYIMMRFKVQKIVIEEKDIILIALKNM